MQEYKYYIPKKAKYQAYGILFTGRGVRGMSYVAYTLVIMPHNGSKTNRFIGTLSLT